MRSISSGLDLSQNGMFALTARYSMSEIRIPSTLENRFDIRLRVRSDRGMPRNRSAGRSPELTTLPAWSTRNRKLHFGQIPQHCTELNSVPQSGHCRDHLSLPSTMWAPQLGNDSVHAAGALDNDFKTDAAARSRATHGYIRQ